MNLDLGKSQFNLTADYQPMGDQPRAIAEITSNLKNGAKHHVLLGVTGSGKTFTMANVIKELSRPALIIAPNKTLAAQLFTEFKELFPQNAVEFFISYYDYFQPEAYIPSTDTYIAKDSSINDDIDKMRHAATRSLFERKDVIIVASVSCIYGLGSPQSYANLVATATKNQKIERNKFLRSLIDIQYTRNDKALVRGTFRVRGDVIDILPSHQKDEAVRVEFFDDAIDSICLIDVLTGKQLREVDEVSIYPNSHYVTDRSDIKQIVREILTDLGIRLRELKALGKNIEYQRLEQRTMHDVELLEQLGWCPGIENYSRYLTGTAPGQPPPTLLDYFPKEFLIILDESHLTVPQLNGMFRGDRARKTVLVEYGFRLPSALDNRPLNFTEFIDRSNQILYVSATPGVWETEKLNAVISEQVIRPTGLLEPEIEIRPASTQVDNLYGEILKTTSKGGRVLVTTLTKQMAEDLTSYFQDLDVRVKYLHADIDSIERVELIRGLRSGDYDVLIGINLLREGLDLPEVQLVAVMDADKEGFLRSRSSLIQVVGRAARNAESRVIFYADSMTDSMQLCIDETKRRREKQMEYNRANGITPTTIKKKMMAGLRQIYGLIEPKEEKTSAETLDEILKAYKIKNTADLEKLVRRKAKEMQRAASELDFEKAAELRDEVRVIKELMISFAGEDTTKVGT